MTVSRVIQIIKDMWTEVSYVSKLRSYYEKLSNTLCTKHPVHNGTVYVQNCGKLGFRPVKFYNNDTFRYGTFHDSLSEAYSEGVCYM